jgi:hypothetical protein
VIEIAGRKPVLEVGRAAARAVSSLPPEGDRLPFSMAPARGIMTGRQDPMTFEEAPAMSLEELRRRFETARIERGSQGQATIIVRRGDFPSRRRQFTGTVRIDHRRIGYLVGRAPRAFDVQPGEHRVTVYLGRKDRVTSAPGRAVVSATITLEAGEEVLLTCGVRPEVARRWSRIDRSGGRNGVFFAIAIYLCAAAGWLIAPFLQGLVAATIVYYLPGILGWIWPLSLIVSPIPAGLYAAVLGGYAIGRWTRGMSLELATNLLPRLGSPYYLEQQPAMGVGGTCRPGPKVPGIDRGPEFP